MFNLNMANEISFFVTFGGLSKFCLHALEHCTSKITTNNTVNYKYG